VDSPFLASLYDETMRLLEDARDYHRNGERREREALPANEGCAMSRECLSMTARLTSVMAWLMVQRAVHAGEMTNSDAASPENRLLAEPIHLTPIAIERQRHSQRLWRLLERSWRLYQRVRRIDGARVLH
jgi:regulator of CtrA degradation